MTEGKPPAIGVEHGPLRDPVLGHGVDGLIGQNPIRAPIEGGLPRLALDPLQVGAGRGQDPRDRLGHLGTNAVTGNENQGVLHAARKISQIE